MNRCNSLAEFARHTNRSCGRALLQRLLLACTLAATMAHAADGDPDTTFGNAGVDYVEWAGGPAEGARIAVGIDAKIYVGATIEQANDNYDFAITRLGKNGGLDFGFGFQGYRTVAFDYVTDGYDRLQGVFPLSDGKLMLLGNAEIAGEIIAASPPAMVRVTANGNVDTTFGSAGRLSITAAQSPWPNARLYLRGVARQPDGKFLFGGHCLNCAGTYSAVALRVDANGTPDASFGQNGWAKIPVPQPTSLWSMGIDRQSRIVIAGNVVENGAHRPMVVRFASTGLADTTFGGGDGVALVTLIDGATVNWGATAVAFDYDDALLVSVASYLPLDVPRTGVIRLLSNGNLPLNYGNGGTGLRDLTREEGSKISAVAMRSDRRLVSAGWIDHSGLDFYGARLLSDGSLDNTFSGNGVARYSLSTSQDEAESMVLAAGKPLMAGISYVAGNRGVSVLRLQSDLIFTDGVE